MLVPVGRGVAEETSSNRPDRLSRSKQQDSRQNVVIDWRGLSIDRIDPL